AVNERFANIKRQAGLEEALTPHSLRHSYVTHLVEHGYAEHFIQEQVGHSYASTTVIYTSVSYDYKNRILRKAYAQAVGIDDTKEPQCPPNPTSVGTSGSKWPRTDCSRQLNY